MPLPSSLFLLLVSLPSPLSLLLVSLPSPLSLLLCLFPHHSFCFLCLFPPHSPCFLCLFPPHSLYFCVSSLPTLPASCLSPLLSPISSLNTYYISNYSFETTLANHNGTDITIVRYATWPLRSLQRTTVVSPSLPSLSPSEHSTAAMCDNLIRLVSNLTVGGACQSGAVAVTNGQQ